MILDAILEFFCFPIIELLELLPAINIELPDDIFNQIGGYFQCLGYVCPIATVSYILVLKAVCWEFKIIMAIIVRVKSFVPFWGS